MPYVRPGGAKDHEREAEGKERGEKRGSTGGEPICQLDYYARLSSLPFGHRPFDQQNTMFQASRWPHENSSLDGQPESPKAQRRAKGEWWKEEEEQLRVALVLVSC